MSTNVENSPSVEDAAIAENEQHLLNSVKMDAELKNPLFALESDGPFSDLPDEDEEESPHYLEGDGYDYVEDVVTIADVITDEVYADFIGKPDAKPSDYKFLSKEPEARQKELADLVVRRIIAAKTASTPWDHDAVVKAAKYTIVQLAAERNKKGEVVKWTVSEEDAEKLAKGPCMMQALREYERQQVLGTVTRLNSEMGLPDKGAIVGDGKRAFDKALFHAIAEKKPTFLYPAIKTNDDGTPKETLTPEQTKARTRYTQKCINLRAAAEIAKEIHNLRKSIGDREYTNEENAEMDSLRAEQARIWGQFWAGTGAAIANAELFFGKAAANKKKRVSLKTVFRSAVTNDSVSFGIHEQ